jgi:hypothetical protein
MSLHRGGAEDRISLGSAVAELRHVFDRVEAGLLVGDIDVEIMLLAGVVD